MKTILLLAGAAALASAADFDWKGTVPAGKTIELKGVNGKITAETAMTGQVEVSAIKHANRSDPASVKIQVVPHGDGVTICAVYPTPKKQQQANECVPGRQGRMNNEDNDVRVDFIVKVPAGVNLAAKTVNGGIVAQHLRSNINADTVNGAVEVSSSELVQAKTVNGSIDARMGVHNWPSPLSFETVNGSISLHMPDGISANVSAATVNGAMKSDFPITVNGRFGPKKMEGKLGNGGPELKLKTVNGSVNLLKS